MNEYKLKEHITKLKKTDRFSFWNDLGSQAIQDLAERIEKAYRLFCRNLQQAIKTAPPGFKKIHKMNSFTLKQAGYKLLDDKRIVIMGKEYRYFKSRAIDGKVKRVTVKRDALGDIYLYIICEDLADKEARSGKSVGLDLGLAIFLTTSTGIKIVSPLFFKQGAAEIKQKSKALSGKKKGSNNRRRARLDLARAYKRMANRRRDYHFKLARQLALEYAVIYLEDLGLKGMHKLWARKINDLGFAEFVGVLQHECAKSGSRLVIIDRYFPPIKTCSTCGSVKGDLSLKDRTWVCASCQAQHDRDINAAININRAGASALSGAEVKPVLASVLC